jgi:transposase InsO family protein
MITEIAKHKAQVLQFWATYGLKAAEDAFTVKKRTLQYWRAQLKRGEGKLEALNPKSRAPYTKRKRLWPNAIIQEMRRLRAEHPNLGKEKLHPFLKAFCTAKSLCCPSVRTIGRLIADEPGKMRIFPVKVRHNGQIVPRKRAIKLRKPKGFVAEYPGHCGSFDTVERFIHGCRRYVLTFTDVYSRFSFAWATTSHASKAAEEFFKVILQVFPYKLAYVLTDNGSEFMKRFDEVLRQLHNVHWHTYPKCPRMNPHVERFNRTIQEEFIDYHEPALLDPQTFNREMIPWLLWYNGERPHWGLNLQSPIQFLMANHPEECKRWWPNTCP